MIYSSIEIFGVSSGKLVLCAVYLCYYHNPMILVIASNHFFKNLIKNYMENFSTIGTNVHTFRVRSKPNMTPRVLFNKQF